MRYKKRSFRPLVLSSGMPRSGSTLLFNILREVMTEKWGNRLTSGSVAEFKQLPRGRAYLIKSHHIPELRLWKPRHTFYSYRDVRVAAVSGYRKFGRQITMEAISEDIDNFFKAKDVADIMFRYEDLVRDTPLAIARIAEAMGIGVDVVKINAAVSAIEDPNVAGTMDRVTSSGHDGVTLRHPDHCTGTQDDDWRSVIPADLAARINDEFGWWFEACGYPTR